MQVYVMHPKHMNEFALSILLINPSISIAKNNCNPYYQAGTHPKVLDMS